jgi:hypothetical protein
MIAGSFAQRGSALGQQVPDHPQYTMWKARHDAELAAASERAARQAERDGLQLEWHQAWRQYEAHWREGLVRGAPWRPRWWDVRSWLHLIFGKDRHR